MIDDEVHTTAAGRPLGAISTLVSLFLLLLVFFVMLFSVARVQVQRMQIVIASIDQAFGGLPSRLGLLPAPPPEPVPVPGDLNTPENFARAVSALITGFTELQATQAPAPRGSLLEIDLPPGEVFVRDGAALTRAASGIVTRLAVLLQHRPNPQQHYRLAFRIVLPSGASADTALALARAGAFAGALNAAGCPDEALAIGLEPGPAPLLRLDFTLAGMPAEAE